MSGIVFYKTAQLEEIVRFYLISTGAEIWLDQGKCVILKHGNMLFGFCQVDRADTSSIITFFYPTAGSINKLYSKLESITEAVPQINPFFRIYHFFARDPEGRKIEFQTFLHPLDEHLSGSDLLRTRRSVREFRAEDPGDELLEKIFELCCYSPTSRNSQAYYYRITRKRNKIEALAAIRDRASRPLAAAPIAVAVCSDPAGTKRPVQDACIAASYLLLAATQYNIGSCWITDMDRPEVKKLMEIPEGYYVACLTPLGFPVNSDLQATEEELRKSDREIETPERREVKEIYRFV